MLGIENESNFRPAVGSAVSPESETSSKVFENTRPENTEAARIRKNKMKGEKEGLRKKGEKDKRELQSELEMSRRALKLKTRELKNIRKLAREVLMQRSNVENFLISSLTTVKENIKQEQGLFPSITQERGLSSSAKLDIADLSWEDRERILRLLFSKINSQAQQTSFARLPEHSFEKSLPRLDSNPTSASEIEASSFSLYASHGELAPLS